MRNMVPCWNPRSTELKKTASRAKKELPRTRRRIHAGKVKGEAKKKYKETRRSYQKEIKDKYWKNFWKKMAKTHEE